MRRRLAWATAQARPSRRAPLIVSESDAVAVDRDDVLLIEDWRLRPDGTAIAPGSDPEDTTAVYTVNGRTTLDFQLRLHERLQASLYKWLSTPCYCYQNRKS